MVCAGIPTRRRSRGRFPHWLSLPALALALVAVAPVSPAAAQSSLSGGCTGTADPHGGFSMHCASAIARFMVTWKFARDVSDPSVPGFTCTLVSNPYTHDNDSIDCVGNAAANQVITGKAVMKIRPNYTAPSESCARPYVLYGNTPTGPTSGLNYAGSLTCVPDRNAQGHKGHKGKRHKGRHHKGRRP